MEVTTTRAIIENKSGDGLTIMQMAFPANAPSARPIAGYALGEKRASRYLDSPNDLTEKREERQDKVINANPRDHA